MQLERFTMSNIGIFWDNTMMFHRMVEDAAGAVEAVTPLMLAAPFFRGKFTGVIVPTGFGNTHYSKMLPALRACAGRIEDYLENGGKMLLFGAADAAPTLYNWLPVNVKYHFEFMEHELDVVNSPSALLFDGYDTGYFACDGWFEEFEGEPIAVSKNTGKPVLVECKIGEGTLYLASTHEYPSAAFLKEFAKGDAVSF